MTTAEKIAEMMNNDGQVFVSPSGETLEDVCVREGAEIDYKDRGIWGEPVAYRFSDGSAIVAIGDGWDFEGSEPYSWESS